MYIRIGICGKYFIYMHIASVVVTKNTLWFKRRREVLFSGTMFTE